MKVLVVFIIFLFSTSLFAQDTGARKAFLPGVSASMISEFGNSNIYPGFNFHYVFVEGVSRPKNSYSFGGYYEWYSEIGFFKELNSSMTNDIFFTCASGMNLSFEKFQTSSRNFLIPYFGAKFGGVFFTKGSSGFFVEPTLGTVLIETENLIVNYDCGLFLNSADLSGRIGLHNSLLVNFNM